MDTGGLSEVAAEDLNMGVDTSSHLDVEAMSSVPWWWSVNASLEQFHPSPSSFSPFSHLPDARPLVIQVFRFSDCDFLIDFADSSI